MSRPPFNVFAGGSLDRVAHRRTDADWLSTALAAPSSRFLPMRGHQHLVAHGDAPGVVALSPDELRHLGLASDAAVFLGTEDGASWFALAVPGDFDAPEGSAWRGLRGLGPLLSATDAALLAHARGMIIWHERHRYCGLCGHAAQSMEGGSLRVCGNPDCGTRHFPRVDPAVIMLVTHGDDALVGRQPAWPEGRYSTIAGFVEPGESLEEAVRREVLEETGVVVDTANYHSSQPWPFPSAIMLGFIATAATREIRLNDAELEEALWATRDDFASGRLAGPTRFSIAWQLLREWYDAEPGRDLARDSRDWTWQRPRD